MKNKQGWFANKDTNLFGGKNHKDFDSKTNLVVSNRMPCWYYDKKRLRETPSIIEGLPLETERRYRKEGARFILDCGTKMGLGINTIATGVIYFHRFYMVHSFKSFPRYVTACCCLFLAGKVEETPKKCRDIIRTARSLLSDDHYYSFGDDPKEEVMTLERILLQTIKFDLQVQHPHTYLLKYAKCFKGDQVKLQKMVQMAWNFVNDSMSTVVCLQWEPEIIAVALIHLASKLSKFTVTDWIGKQPQHSRWWDMFVGDVTMEILEDICHQVLDLYQTNQKDGEPKSPPQKPPSRAESPTPIRTLPLSSNTGSPTGKNSKTSAAASVTTANPSNETTNALPIKTITGATNATVTTADTETTPATAPPLTTGSFHHMFHAPPPLNAHHMHGNMYTSANNNASGGSVVSGAGVGPPPSLPPSGFPGSGAGPAPPLPPAPPAGLPPYAAGPPPPNAWAPMPSHYGSLPPPIPHAGAPPPSHSSGGGGGAAGGASNSSNNSGNYYNSSGSSSSYSRQSRY